MTDIVDIICRSYPNLETLTLETYEMYYFLFGDIENSSPKHEKFRKMTRIFVSIKNYMQLPLDMIDLSDQKLLITSKKTNFINYLREKCPKITNFQTKDEKGEIIISENHHEVGYSGNTNLHRLISFEFLGKSNYS